MKLCRSVVEKHPYPLIFATVSGAHLYGFASEDSDYDLRGIHVLPAREVVGLLDLRETVQSEGIVEGVEIDLVTHDAIKFLRLMLKRNGYVLEQLLSPLVIATSSTHEELIALAPRCITRHHAHHYLGFADTQWNLFQKENPPRVKPLLYVFRVLLTGIHLMQTGVVEANLPRLNAHFRLSYIDDLIGRKIGGKEKELLTDGDGAFFRSEYIRLVRSLEQAYADTSLPDAPSALLDLNDVLVRVRLAEQSLPGFRYA